MKGFAPCLTSGPRISRDVRKLAQTSRSKKDSVQFNNLENRCHQEKQDFETFETLNRS